MNDWRNFYEEKLYPLQNGILDCVKNSGTQFFLTGGTALSRGYFDHRYSDDLDLFVKDPPDFHEQVEQLLEYLQESGFEIDSKNMVRAENFVSMMVSEPSFSRRTGRQTEQQQKNMSAKIDLVNDSAPVFGDFVQTQVFFRTDNWTNILSNKLCAVLRLEPKDVADIWILAKKKRFNWGEMLDQAREKELGLDPVIVADVLRGIPEHEFTRIRWVDPPEWERFINDMDHIAVELVNGEDNSLQ
jgi:predicted nucleotidyltransferase component of viral defense system